VQFLYSQQSYAHYCTVIVKQIIGKKLSGYIDLNSLVAARRRALDKAGVPKILAKFGHIAVGILLLIPFLTTS
jgi:hypothetical protein